jgi:hypothetical protein
MQTISTKQAIKIKSYSLDVNKCGNTELLKKNPKEGIKREQKIEKTKRI